MAGWSLDLICFAGRGNGLDKTKLSVPVVYWSTGKASDWSDLKSARSAKSAGHHCGSGVSTSIPAAPCKRLQVPEVLRQFLMYCVTGRRGFGLDRAGIEIRDAATGTARRNSTSHCLEALMVHAWAAERWDGSVTSACSAGAGQLGRLRDSPS